MCFHVNGIVQVSLTVCAQSINHSVSKTVAAVTDLSNLTVLTERLQNLHCKARNIYRACNSHLKISVLFSSFPECKISICSDVRRQKKMKEYGCRNTPVSCILKCGACFLIVSIKEQHKSLQIPAGFSVALGSIWLLSMFH